MTYEASIYHVSLCEGCDLNPPIYPSLNLNISCEDVRFREITEYNEMSNLGADARSDKLFTLNAHVRVSLENWVNVESVVSESIIKN